MYFEEEEEYMSEPIDEKSQSSYIKINKRFMEQLKQANHIDDFSRYRHDSDDQQETKTNNFMTNQPKSSKKQHQNNKIDLNNSPIKSNFYKDIIDQDNEEGPRNDSIVKSTGSKNKSINQTPQDKRHLIKVTQKISKLSHFDKKQTCTPADNTFQYYLLRKSHDCKYKDTQFLDNQLREDNHMNDLQTKPQLFSPKHQLSASNRNQNQPKAQFQRINYKKLLESQISKNKDLEKQVYKLESKLASLNIQYEESIKYSKKLEKQVNGANKIRKQNKNRMKELDLKLEGFKTVCKLKNTQKDHLIIETKKQNKILQEQNEKYRIFTETLAQSIFVLKGKKPKNLQDVWSEWKEIFETFSKNKWTVANSKSPKKRV